VTHTWGDDATYTIVLELEDDDDGAVSFTTSLDVDNLDPFSVSFAVPITGGEGAILDFQSIVKDPGSDDLTFEWDWGDGLTDTLVFYNDGAGPDPDPSPWGTYPFIATCDISHIYGDDGSYDLEVLVSDDDGGSALIATTFDVINYAPRVVNSSLPDSSDEGEKVTFSIEAVDPGSDDLVLDFDWGDGTTETVVFYNDGVGPDPDPSPWGLFPFFISTDLNHTYGDNGDFTVTLTITDDDGGNVSISRDITVNNVDPTIDPSSVEAKAIVDLTLRVAGEKWHDVSLEIAKGGVLVQLIYIVRMPGSPNDQAKTVRDVTLNLFEDTPLVVRYTPLDDPISGSINGANPTWVILTFTSSSEVKLKHTFNVRHPDTWILEIKDISSYFIGEDITFSATASDPGSDDLTFTWDWGDGTNSSSTHYNDGVGPDPYPSPEVNPITATDVQTHAFALPKIYWVTITVTDDDGGSNSLTFSLKL